MTDDLDAVADSELREYLSEVDLHGDDVRVAFRYEGESYDLLHVRDDVRAQFTDEEFERRIQTLMMKGLGDPPSDGSLFDFGELDATLRFYDAVVVASFPDEDWSGVIVVADRTDSETVERTLESLENDEL
ncbi:hypothetical protein [Haloarchaeobius litoreus]|uniref:Uncharacterized protein n=1 Tax=Haloarchaeobius litoreus TaxID=755306 RepID=A0ABD6DLT4_9EURY|nr:hypothetical protein [Haloarchaeobius litoreus]